MRFQIAERLIRGETDSGKIARELNVGLGIVYNIRSDLTKHGLQLTIAKPAPNTHNYVSPETPITRDEESQIDEERVGPQESAIANTDEETLRELAKLIVSKMRENEAQKPQLQEANLPFENVSIESEKQEFTIPLRPVVYQRYSIFKARLASSGEMWEGDFGDFLFYASEVSLALRGLYPTALIEGASRQENSRIT